MTLALACASHSPLMFDRPGLCSAEVRAAIVRGFAELSDEVRRFEPELIVQFSPDHFNGFLLDLMPTFCVGVAAESVGDWGTQAGPLDVPLHDATQLARTLVSANFDIAISWRMQVDHGFVQIWEALFGSARGLPLIPIFVNCAAPPLPTFRRARELGEAVGRFASASGRRVLIVASGGLSHDPPTPSIYDAPLDIREHLISGHHPTAASRAAREDRVRAAGLSAAGGSPSALPVSEDWDRSFLKNLCEGPHAVFDDLDMDELVRCAGRGGPEVLCWVSAMAALRSGGPAVTRMHAYHAVQGWVAGMAILSGENLGAIS